MHTLSRPKRATGRVIGTAILVAVSCALSGCYWPGVGEGENVADAYEDFAGFCGFLQDCGGNGNSRMGNPPANSETSSDGSSSSGSSAAPTGD